MKLVGLISKAYAFGSPGFSGLQGGAQISHFELLSALARRHGHECHLLTAFPARKVTRVGGVAIASFRDREELWQTVESLRPDAVLGALALSCEAVRVAEHLGVPALLFPHSYEAAPLSESVRRRCGLSGTEAALTASEWEYAFNNAKRVYACSRYLHRLMIAQGRPCSGFLHPEFAVERTLVARLHRPSDGCITGICGFTFKGAAIFLELARTFPDERFQLFGTVEPSLMVQFERQANIKLRPHAPLPEILRTSKLIVVPSQWPEPFGRIAVEAAANGVPVLVSATAGLIEAAPHSRLQVKNFRRAAGWKKQVGDLLRDSGLRAEHGELARRLAQRFLKGATTRRIHSDLERLSAARTDVPNRSQVTVLCGNHSAKTAFSLVNTELAASATRSGKRRVVTLESPAQFNPVRRHVIVYHDYGRDFKSIDFSDEGRVIAIRTWDFGKFPAAWVERINNEIDQLWVHCRWVRDNAIRSGIAASKVRVIPLGVDGAVFNPHGRKWRAPTHKTFRFLFVGRTVVRKGIDKLLAAYAAAFTPGDDVCLVIKDNSQDVFYKGIDYRKQILDFAADPCKPEVLYLDRYLSTAALASLYRTCDVGVFPYRAEGFCIPILEAMACGVPVIAPRFGACLDFCSEQNAFLVPAKRISLPVSRVFAINTLGFEEHVDEVDFCEVPVEILAARMRAVFETPQTEIVQRGRAASRTALGSFRWTDTVACMQKFIDQVSTVRVPIRLRRRRQVLERNLALFDVAKHLFLGRSQG